MENNRRSHIEIAERVSDAYIESGNISASLVGGSLALGLEDHFSDIDLFLFWKTPPDEDQRRDAVKRADGRVDVSWSAPPSNEKLQALLLGNGGNLGQIWPFESDEWSEQFTVNGISVGISGFLSSAVDDTLSKMRQGGLLTDDMQIVLSAISSGLSLHGNEIIDDWKRSTANYPLSASRTLIGQAISFDIAWQDCEKWAVRNQHLIMMNLISSMVDKIVRTLLALNRIFLPDPRHKWLDYYINKMDVKPKDAGARIKALSRMDLEMAIKEVEALFLETLDLVDDHFPGLNTVFSREWINFRRPVIKNG